MALSEYVRPVAYCEIDSYCQSVLLQRMSEGHLPKAPIWDDIRTFPILGETSVEICGEVVDLPAVDIISGGFPCQDISVAGAGKGLAGERSGLFFEILRLAEKIKPQFIFLENVPAITTRGGLRVVREIASLGYDCRWCVISAAEVGACHRRERWFLLANAKYDGTLANSSGSSIRESITPGEQYESAKSIGKIERTSSLSTDVAHANSNTGRGVIRELSEKNEKLGESQKCRENEAIEFNNGRQDDCNTSSSTSKQADQETESIDREQKAWRKHSGQYWPYESRTHWQDVVSTICRVDDGVPNRVERLKSLGNAVVPIQVREAFEVLVRGERCLS